jgi:predicted RNase H-related nuclease YkuK (DUF458 family)
MNEVYRASETHSNSSKRQADRHVEVHLDINPDEMHGYFSASFSRQQVTFVDGWLRSLKG